MKSEAKAELERILGAYDDKLTEVERLGAAERTAQAEFPVRFATLRAEIIRPALHELVQVLSAHGHEVTVSEKEGSSSNAGGVTLAATSLRIVPKPFARKVPAKSENFIEVTFAANPAERKVIVSSTNTTVTFDRSVGDHGEYAIDALTADVVVSAVLQTLKDAFTGTK
jgi:hypothetical protein